MSMKLPVTFDQNTPHTYNKIDLIIRLTNLIADIER